jgi:hypothetical protein
LGRFVTQARVTVCCGRWEVDRGGKSLAEKVAAEWGPEADGNILSISLEGAVQGNSKLKAPRGCCAWLKAGWLVEEREEEKEQVKRKRRGQGGKKPSKWDRASEALEGFWLFLTARWEPLARL